MSCFCAYFENKNLPPPCTKVLLIDPLLPEVFTGPRCKHSRPREMGVEGTPRGKAERENTTAFSTYNSSCSGSELGAEGGGGCSRISDHGILTKSRSAAVLVFHAFSTGQEYV